MSSVANPRRPYERFVATALSRFSAFRIAHIANKAHCIHAHIHIFAHAGQTQFIVIYRSASVLINIKCRLAI